MFFYSLEESLERSLMTIQERIDFLMKKQNITKAELARRIEKPYTTVDNWFKRNSCPNSEVIQSLAAALNTTTEWLVSGTEPEASPELEPKEQQLIKHYRAANPEGQSRILEQAELMALRYPKQGSSSEYKIG